MYEVATVVGINNLSDDVLLKIEKELTSLGYIVMFSYEKFYDEYDQNKIEQLKNMTKHKIYLSDKLFVIDENFNPEVNEYIQYAKRLLLPISYITGVNYIVGD